MTWAERADSDPTLRAFIDAKIARAHVDLQVLRVEHERDQRVIDSLHAKLTDCRKAAKAKP
jgi:hypothetical protein